MTVECDVCKSERPLIAVAVESPSGRQITRVICHQCIKSIALVRDQMEPVPWLSPEGP